MEKTKDPGISLKHVSLVKCCVGGLKQSENRRYAVGIANFIRSVSEDGTSMQIEIDFNLLDRIPDPSLDFTCTFLAEYERKPESSMTFPDFKNHIVVAHILPFLREFAFNITGRLRGSPALMIPPINANVLLANWEKNNRLPESAVAPQE
jgi:hypothetical protein